MLICALAANHCKPSKTIVVASSNMVFWFTSVAAPCSICGGGRENTWYQVQVRHPCYKFAVSIALTEAMKQSPCANTGGKKKLQQTPYIGTPSGHSFGRNSTIFNVVINLPLCQWFSARVPLTLLCNNLQTQID